MRGIRDNWISKLTNTTNETSNEYERRIHKTAVVLLYDIRKFNTVDNISIY